MKSKIKVIYPVTDNNKARWNLISTVGSIDKINKITRRHTVTFQDLTSFWGTSEQQLPIICDNPNQFKYIHIFTGKIPNKAKVILRLGSTCEDPDSIELYVNSSPVSFINMVESDLPYTKNKLLNFQIDPQMIYRSCVVEIATKGNSFKIDFAEIVVIPD